MFRDITTLLQEPATFRRLVDCFIHRYCEQDLDGIACIDARGFIIGGALAYERHTKLIPVRKKGKLPFETVSQSYSLEYGEAEVEIHKDAISEGERILVLDDLIATGGTMLAATSLVERLGGIVVEAAGIIDLPDLGGSTLLRDKGYKVFSVCEFEGE